MFSCTYCEIFKKTYFEEHLRKAASKLAKRMQLSIQYMLVLLTKCAVSCGFGHIYWRNTEWKTSFFVQCFLININNNQKQDSQVFESIGRALKNFFKFTGKKICDVAVFKNNCSSRSFLQNTSGRMHLDITHY